MTYQAWIADKLSCQPQKGLFEVVVGLSGDIVVLEVLLPMESDGLGLHFALFDVHFVAAKDDWDLFADTDKVTWEMVIHMLLVMVAEDVRCQLGTFL